MKPCNRLLLSTLFVLFMGQPVCALEVGTEFPISANNETLIGFVAGFDGSRYLVLYNHTSGCYAQFVSATATLSGGPILVSPDASGLGLGGGAFDGSRYLVAVIDSSGQVNGRFLSTDGTLEGAAFPISTGATAAYARVVYGAGAYLVIWEDIRNGDGNDDIYGRVVTTGGGISGAEIPISTAANDQRQPALGCDGTNYLVVWYDYRGGGDAYTYGQFVAPDGGLSGANFAISQSASFDAMVPSVAFGRENYLVVWHKNLGDFTAPNWEVICDLYGRIVSPQATFPKGDEFVITDAPNTQQFPSAAFNQDDFLVAWYD